MESDLAGKIKHHFVENGFGKTLYWVTLKFLKNSITNFINVRKSVMIEKSLSGRLPFAKSTIDVTFKFGELSDFDPFRQVLKPWGRFYNIFKKRFHRGQTCIVCSHEGKAIGYIWVSCIPETDKHYGVTVRPKDDETYGFDLYVLPEYRKFLIGYELISRWLKFSYDSGKKKAIGMVANINKPMLMTTRLVFGFKIAKQFRTIEFLRWRGVIIASKEVAPSS